MSSDVKTHHLFVVTDEVFCNISLFALSPKVLAIDIVGLNESCQDESSWSHTHVPHVKIHF